MNQYKKWLLVGGTGRNIGKSTASECFIGKLSQQVKVVGVKISNAHPGDFAFHGNHEIDREKPFVILEEKDRSGNKDSMRFLKAGAVRSYFVASNDEYLENVLEELSRLLLPDEWVVCESNGLRNLIEPGLFVMVKGEVSKHPKKNLDFLLEQADYVIPALNKEATEKLTESLNIKNGKMVLM